MAGTFRHSTGWHYFEGKLLSAFMALLRLFPHRLSLGLAGAVGAFVLAPLSGANRRTRENLALVRPGMSARETRRFCRRVNDQSARAMIETFNVEEFLRHAEIAPLTGDGKELISATLAAGKPVILVSGHFGNFHVVRVRMDRLGYPTAAIYRKMNNPYANSVYVDNLNRLARPNYERGPSGTRMLVRHLRQGHSIALLNDQAILGGRRLKFFGRDALTAISAAQMSLKYDARIFPCYAIRLENGVDFRVEIEPPIEPGDPLAMTQALNDSLEAMVRRYPEQWFWLHRRWKTWGSTRADRSA
ncbi:MAG: lysophospholipid acyltransferase family protein [Paracoccaceae bacterium]